MLPVYDELTKNQARLIAIGLNKIRYFKLAGNYDKVVRIYYELLRAKNTQILNYRGKSRIYHYYIYDYSKAIKNLDTAIKFQAQNMPAIYYRKGMALKGLKRYLEALTAFDLAIKYNPNHSGAIAEKIEILSILYDHKLVIGTFD